MKNKFLLLLSAFFFVSTTLFAQEAAKKYDLLLLSGIVRPVENIQDASKLMALPGESFNGNYYRIIQFRAIPTDQEKLDLKASGIGLIVYLPNYSYFASVRTTTNISTANTKGNIRAVLPVLPEYKTHPSLVNNAVPQYAEVVAGKFDIVITYYKGIPGTLLETELKSRIPGLEMVTQDDVSQTATVRVTKDQVSKLTQISFIQYVEPYDPPRMENNSGTTEHRSNTINSPLASGLHYDGTGVGVSVGDGGDYFAHVDFTGRQTGGLTSGAADHGTHVAGTIAGCGNIDPRYAGQATGAHMIYSSGFADISTVAAFGALYTGTDLIRITNHSLGESVNAGYTSTARMSDLIVETYPSAFNVHSCGNSGSSWSTITGGYKAGKNAIATGALDYKDLVVSFSSRGPSKDGRIKPDICAKGNAVQSTMPNNLYGNMSGTSMASPGAAGCIAQLMHAYRSLNANADPKLAQLKAIVLNTAEDLGNTGPDYTYGWGRMNVWKAYNAIKDQRYLSSTIANAGNNKHVIVVPANVVEMRVMVYWADPAAAAGAAKALINDLDITVSSTSLNYNPWQLDNLSPGTAAVKGPDTDNNMEQVSILNPAAGSYTLNVNGTIVPQGPQEYWVTYEFITDDITVTYPMGGESFVPAETQYVRWEASGTTGTFTVEYSSNGGTSWVVLSSAVAGTARYYTWTVPAGVTGQALIRVTRGAKTDMSDANFNIIPVPTNLQILWRCPTNFEIGWNAVTGATDYEVFVLGQKYMMPQGQTAWLSWIVNAPSTSITWASVRALANGQVIGRRALAIQVGTSTTNCPPTSINEILADSPYGISVYPNPVSGLATITVSIPEEEVVSVKLVDVFGKDVVFIASDEKLPAGEHPFSLENLPAGGIYFVTVQGSRGTSIGKIVVAGH